MKTYNIAIVGATGAVGRELIRVLEESAFPVGTFVPLASLNSAGTFIKAFGKDYEVLETTHEIFAQAQIDIAFFSAGGSISEIFAKSAAKTALVIDNTSFFRLHLDVPLVVPEVNADEIFNAPSNIIANPNCSTIQMVHILNPLHLAFGIESVNVSTYQAVSGAGNKGIESLKSELKLALELLEQNPKAHLDKELSKGAFAYPIAFNAIPHIDVFNENGFTKEELKMVHETHKIMQASFAISATCVRVPILRSHSESLSIRFSKEVSAKEVREVLEKAQNVIVQDDPSNQVYPMALTASGSDSTFVGRIREDLFDKQTLHCFCVADQLRVGAATNALKIAWRYIERS
ncbi:aspartate-semialdehyde dehydrogenase [Helicobacter cetorum]|uniref:aspartate-semialdehyde dehydrogenase n=1 Tax=Helicobacter cetorum TaxID=138563 RepID=UPI000CF14EB7|nr:aspartate-semialdehyde dehydrogenase [Helicobacter cetorum]